MPGGDRSGPMGQGPRSGRGMGYCSGYNAPGGASGRGFGRGRGACGFGRGRGYWGQGFYQAGPVQGLPEPSSRDLREKAEQLQAELDMIRERLGRLEADQAQD